MDERNFTPRDLLSASAWSSILFTTYSLSLSFVEAVPLAAVSRSVRNFTILADLAGYMSSLSDVGAIGVGRDYDLVPIKVSGGVFHPKISLFADEDGNVRATVGSGNLSFGGWGYNNEVLELLRPGRDSRCFSDIAAMFESISDGAMQGGRLECLRPAGLGRFIELATRAASIPGAGRSRMLHTMGGSLVTQIKDMADELGGAQRFTAVSPFFSGHLGIKALAEGLGCDDVSIAVPPLAPSIFDFSSASDAGMRCKPVTSSHFNDSRSLHSKLYDIECERGRLVVTGSANATTAALLGRNVEAVIIRPCDLSVSFGWEATTRGGGTATHEREPRESSGAGLIVDYNGGVIVGRVLGVAAEGGWEAVISSGTTRGPAGTVRVGADGRFKFEPPPSLEPIALGTSVQVVLIREDQEVRGWLVLCDLIRDISRRGPIARVMARMASGLDTVSDVAAILDYFARDPKVLFDAAERSGGGRTDRRAAMPHLTGELSALQGQSALDMKSTWAGGEAEPTGDGLIDALVRRLAETMPEQNDDAADDDDDSVVPGAASGSSGRPPKRGRRIPRPMAEKAFDHLFKKLEEYPAGSVRAPGLFALFDMMIHIVPRTETPDELLPVLMRRWILAAVHARPADADPISLDQCICIIAAMTVIGDPGSASKMHSVLQSWFGGELDEDTRLLFEPLAEGREERKIHPRGINEEWKHSWAEIVGSRTQWSIMNQLRREIAAGESVLTIPDGATPIERTIMRKVAAGEARPDKIAYITTRRSGKAGCPGCYTGLPSEQRLRLGRHRLATCAGMRCSRIIIDVSL